jgi:hypothetical protein
MSEKEDKKGKASEDDLLTRVDKKFEKRLWKIYFSRKLPFSSWARILVLGFLFIIYFIAAYLLYLVNEALSSIVSKLTASEALTVYLSMVAAFIALASFSVSIIDFNKPESEYKVLVHYNYEVLKQNVPNEKLPLLKALVILKSKHPEFSLKEFLHPLDKSMTNEKLFEILYNANTERA